MPYGGPKGSWASRNGLCMPSSRAYMCSTARSRVRVNGQYSKEFWCGSWALSLAHCSSSWCWKHFHVSSAQVCCGGFSTLTTWCSSRTPRRSVSPSSRHRRLTSKVKGSTSTWWRPSSWYPMSTMMSSRNLASTPVLSAVVVFATTPSNAGSASCGSTRGAVASLNDWRPTQTVSLPGVMARLGQSTTELWLKWMSAAPCWMWKPLSVTWVTCIALVGAVTVHCPQMLRGLGKVQETFASPNHQRHLSPNMHDKMYVTAFAQPSMVAKRWEQTPLICSGSPPMTVPWSAGFVAPKPRRNTFSFATTETWHGGYYNVFHSRWLIEYGHVQRAMSCI